MNWLKLDYQTSFIIFKFLNLKNNFTKSIQTGPKYSNVEYCVSLYTSIEMIEDFQWHIENFNIFHKEGISLEACSKEERPNMATINDSLIPYFYIFLLVINDLGVLIHFTLFEAEVIATGNVTPS